MLRHCKNPHQTRTVRPRLQLSAVRAAVCGFEARDRTRAQPAALVRRRIGQRARSTVVRYLAPDHIEGVRSMQLTAGQVGVVTGAGSGIGLALAERLAERGLNLVLADVQDDALGRGGPARRRRRPRGPCGPYRREQGGGRSGTRAHRPSSGSAPCTWCATTPVWRPAPTRGSGRCSAWEWVMGVNFWGVVYGCRAFLPHLAGGGGHIVNTASIAGLLPGFIPATTPPSTPWWRSARTSTTRCSVAGLPIGVSVLCPGWVRTNITDADRNWPAELGERPLADPPGRSCAPTPDMRSPRVETGLRRRRRRRADQSPAASGSSRTRNSSSSRCSGGTRSASAPTRTRPSTRPGCRHDRR